MGSRAAGVLMVLLVTACGSASGRTTQPSTTRGPNPVDVSAAQVCNALDVFATDAKQHQPNEADSQALNDAEQKLKGTQGHNGPWKLLADDVDAFVSDAANGDLKTAAQDGQRAGVECAKVPPDAAAAVGRQNP